MQRSWPAHGQQEYPPPKSATCDRVGAGSCCSHAVSLLPPEFQLGLVAVRQTLARYPSALEVQGAAERLVPRPRQHIPFGTKPRIGILDWLSLSADIHNRARQGPGHRGPGLSPEYRPLPNGRLVCRGRRLFPRRGKRGRRYGAHPKHTGISGTRQQYSPLRIALGKGIRDSGLGEQQNGNGETPRLRSR